MRNILNEFIEKNGRKATEHEVGMLMKLSAKGTAGEKKLNESIYAYGKTSQTHDNLGGRVKQKVKLSENGKRINDLMHKKFDAKTISLILDLKETSVNNIIRYARLPRTADQILND
jgi:hypothetical protein